MEIRSINAPDGPVVSGGYSQAVEVRGASRIVYVSGQIPVGPRGEVPEGFEEQARLVWRNVTLQLSAAGMGLENIVKHTTYLSHRAYRDANRAVREEVLGHLSPALTVIITDIFDETWFLEVDVVAVA
jgi:enamine deaminase RidA (YjgF/YER057c/UK114 family)